MKQENSIRCNRGSIRTILYSVLVYVFQGSVSMQFVCGNRNVRIM